MESPFYGESTNFGSLLFEAEDESLDGESIEGGILLLSEAQRAPDFLDLQLDIESDVEEPALDNPESDSDEDVIVLGEKRPTYQEITLEEDEEGGVSESIVEKEKEKGPVSGSYLEEFYYECPKCDKSFRVESLLKFHVKMHNAAPAEHFSLNINAGNSSEENASDKQKEKKDKKNGSHSQSNDNKRKREEENETLDKESYSKNEKENTKKSSSKRSSQQTHRSKKSRSNSRSQKMDSETT